jgi:hypothetical protein
MRSPQVLLADMRHAPEVELLDSKLCNMTLLNYLQIIQKDRSGDFRQQQLVQVIPVRRFVELNQSAIEIVKLLDGHRAKEEVVWRIGEIL